MSIDLTGSSPPRAARAAGAGTIDLTNVVDLSTSSDAPVAVAVASDGVVDLTASTSAATRSARKRPLDAGPAAAAARPPKRAAPAARSDAAGDRAQELDAAGAPAAAGAAARRVRNRTSKHECGCCFDEVAASQLAQCSSGHLFCFECVGHYAKEELFGKGTVVLRCMSSSGSQGGDSRGRWSCLCMALYISFVLRCFSTAKIGRVAHK